MACHERHREGFPLWVTFPFDPAAHDGQPEVLARVVRCKTPLESSAEWEEIALHFEGIPRHPTASVAQKEVPVPKNGSDRAVAIPIRVRPRHIPWFEEAMTVEISADKLRFISNRQYAPGDTLLVAFAYGEAKPWEGIGDIPATIVNVEKLPQSASLVITLKRFAA